jgi:hypothetical protein
MHPGLHHRRRRLVMLQRSGQCPVGLRVQHLPLSLPLPLVPSMR